MARLLITGATGFVGRALIEHLRRARPGQRLWGCGLEPCPADLSVDDYTQADLADPAAAADLVAAANPQAVIHLAALIASDNLGDCLGANVTATENLYRALSARPKAQQIRIVQMGTAAIYGVPQSLPISEDAPLRPVSYYALSKAAQDQLAAAMGLSHGLQIVRARVFNILGPGQGAGLVPMTFVKQLRQARAAKADKLLVGDVTPRRDFLDVRDVAAALDALLEQGRSGRAYNLGSGSDVSIREMIEELMRVAGLSLPLEVDPLRLRPCDVPVVRADISRVTTETSWRPLIAWRQSLADMWNL
ncbi:MAG: GDP-mannose 4,6-dehydratase [Planctomycetaceae bacterium]|nr:GDP-mannose 4,6-dehydratase [Planctomycetaceae bacterium]